MQGMTEASLRTNELNTLIEQNVVFARNIARKFYRERMQLGVDYGDLEGAAFLGLCSAASRFDAKRGLEFKSYCSVRVRGAIYDHLRATGPLPRRKRLLVPPAVKANEANNAEHATEPVVDAEPVDNQPRYQENPAERKDIIAYYENLGFFLQLDQESPSESTYFVDATPEGLLFKQQMIVLLYRSLQSLPERQRKILELRYFEDKTLDEIGAELGGLRRSWVCRLHQQAVSAIKQSILSELGETSAGNGYAYAA